MVEAAAVGRRTRGGRGKAGGTRRERRRRRREGVGRNRRFRSAGGGGGLGVVDVGRRLGGVDGIRRLGVDGGRLGGDGPRVRRLGVVRRLGGDGGRLDRRDALYRRFCDGRGGVDVYVRRLSRLGDDLLDAGDDDSRAPPRVDAVSPVRARRGGLNP